MNGDLSERWPVLRVLAVAYFNEEWPEDYETPADVVDVFLSEHGQFLQAVTEEVEEVLEVYEGGDLSGFFEEVDLLVDPALDLNSYRGWLEGVARRARNYESDVSEEAPGAQSAIDVTNFPALSALGASCFGAGWRQKHYSATRLVLEEFLATQPVLASRLPGEIGRLLSGRPDEQLGLALRSLSIDYDPALALNTNRGWLTEVARFVEVISLAIGKSPALRQLIKAYFDEDWSEESDGDPRAVVTTFAVNEPDLAPRLPSEIDALLSRGEGEAATVVRSLGSYYDTEGDGLSYAAWLTYVRQEVTRVLGHGQT